MKDLTVTLENRPGRLADLGDATGKAGVNNEEVCGTTGSGQGVIHICRQPGATATRRRSAMALPAAPVTGVLTIVIALLPNTSSKVRVYLLSRSRISRRAPSSARSRPRLRACWVTQPPVGLVEQPASQTLRLACAMKHST
jgi:hypothetical protein